MSHINNKKQKTIFQTTPQTHSIIKTKVLVILNGLFKLWLIIINNILVIVSGITKRKTPLLSMVSLTVVSLLDFLVFLPSPSTL